MKIIRRVVGSLALVLVLAPATGCTSWTVGRFDASGFGWTADVLESARR